MTIPIISLWQPWASLVVFGEKHIETRSWKWPGELPSFLAIHAAQKWNRNLFRMSLGSPFLPALAQHYIEFPRTIGSVSRGNLPFGAVVGVVRIVECASTNFLHLRGNLASKYLAEFHNERAFGDYGPDRYAWVFDKHLALETPIPLRGHQSIWRWEPTDEVKKWMANVPVDMLV